MMKPLTERMEKASAPKTWIAEVAKLDRTIEEKQSMIEEHLEVIDALARIVEEYEGVE